MDYGVLTGGTEITEGQTGKKPPQGLTVVLIGSVHSGTLTR